MFIRCCGESGGVFIIPTSGGTERRLTGVHQKPWNHLSRAVHWSPDGKSVVLADRGASGEPISLFLVSVNTGSRSKLTFPAAPSVGDNSPAYSPDGKWIAFTRRTAVDTGDFHMVPAAGGEVRRLTSDNQMTGGFAWTPDGKEIVFSSPPRDRMASGGFQ